MFFYFYFLIGLCSSLLLDKKYRKEDYMTCNSNKTDHCTKIELEHKGYHCCKLEQITQIGATVKFDRGCNTLFTPTKTISDELNSERGKRMLKEIYGATNILTGKKNISSDEKHFECNDGKVWFNFRKEELTEKEEELIQSNNYCLRFIYSNNTQIQPKKEECYNSVLTDKSQELGLKCGYYEFKIELNNNQFVEYKTCFIWNDDIITNNSLGYLIKSNIESLAILNNINNDVSEYVVRFSKSNDKIYKYASATDNIIEEINYSNILSFKYLLILFLLYL